MKKFNKFNCKHNVGSGFQSCSKMKIIASMLIGAIVVSGVSVFATTKYFATQIEYKEGKNVSQALNELYGMKTDLDTLNSNLNQTTATSDKILQGYKAYSNGELLTGTYSSTTTKGSEWNKGTFVSVSGANSINIGFVPSELIILRANKDIGYVYDSLRSTTVAIKYSSVNNKNDIFNVNVLSSGTPVSGQIVIGNTSKVYIETAGNNWYWYAIK